MLIFIHQDMLLTDEKCLEQFYNYLVDKEKTIAGVTGYSIKEKTILSDIYRWSIKKKLMKSTNGEIHEVYSLGECMFAMKRSLWEEMKFNEKVCDNWHLYAVEMCYRNMLNGGTNVVMPSEIWHNSTPGKSFNNSYLKSLKKFIKEYKKKIDILRAPCTTIKCNINAYNLYVLKLKLKKILKGK